MSDADTECLAKYPNVRRFLMMGFTRLPRHDAPKYGLICLESPRQRLFVEPNSGYFKVAINIR